MLQYSLALRNSLLGNSSGDGVSGNIANGFIYVYASADGTIPATADTALVLTSGGNHSLLCKITADAGVGSAGLTFVDPPTGGVLVKTVAETWSTGTGQSASGGSTASGQTGVFFRFCDASDTPGAAGTTSSMRVQGSIGTTAAYDMVLPSGAAFANATNFTLNDFQIVDPNA